MQQLASCGSAQTILPASGGAKEPFTQGLSHTHSARFLPIPYHLHLCLLSPPHKDLFNNLSVLQQDMHTLKSALGFPFELFLLLCYLRLAQC